MARVFLPRRLQSLAGGLREVDLPGATVRQVIDGLEARFPGIKARLCDAQGDALARGLAVTVDGVAGELGLLERVAPDSEVHFLAAIAGGRGAAR